MLAVFSIFLICPLCVCLLCVYLQPQVTDVTFLENLAQDAAPAEAEASVPAGLDSAPQPAPASPQAAKDGVYHPPHAIMVEVPDFLKPQPMARKPASDGNASDCGSSGGDSVSAPAPVRVGRVYKAEASASWCQDKEFVKVENKHGHAHAAHAGLGDHHAPAPKVPLPAYRSRPASMAPPEASVQPAKPRSLAKAPLANLAKAPLANPFCLLEAAGDMDDAEVAEPAFV